MLSCMQLYNVHFRFHRPRLDVHPSRANISYTFGHWIGLRDMNCLIQLEFMIQDIFISSVQIWSWDTSKVKLNILLSFKVITTLDLPIVLSDGTYSPISSYTHDFYLFIIFESMFLVPCEPHLIPLKNTCRHNTSAWLRSTYLTYCLWMLGPLLHKRVWKLKETSWSYLLVENILSKLAQCH